MKVIFYHKGIQADPDEPDKEKSQEDAAFICKSGYWHFISAYNEYFNNDYIVVFTGYKQNDKDYKYLYEDELVDF